MSGPLVSIIMPAYNVGAYIEQAVRSVLQQTIADWELIIVNDGSTDDTAEIARRLAETDSRITVYSKTNGGLSDARNFGLPFAMGEFVHFFDSDDTVAQDFYERLSAVLRSRPELDFVGCGSIYKFYEDGIECRTERRCMGEYEPGQKLTMDMASNLPEQLNPAWNKLYRRKFFTDNNLFFDTEAARYEDAELMNRILVLRPRFAYIDYCGYIYAFRNEMTLGKIVDDDSIRIFKQSIRFLKENLERLGADEKVVKLAPMRNSIYHIKFYTGCLYSQELSASMRLESLGKMLSDKELQEMMKLSGFTRPVDHLFRFLFVNRCRLLIHLLFTLKFRRRKKLRP